MSLRFNPLWWPVLAATSPAWAPLLAARRGAFQTGRERARRESQERVALAQPLDLPELEFLRITPLVEWRTKPGLAPDSGVCLWLQSDRGNLLLDLGYGPERPALAKNATLLGFDFRAVEALVISHLHPDHMGGLRAKRANRVLAPSELGDPDGMPCYLPAPAETPGFLAQVVQGPGLLPAGLATTGPLPRQLFFFGWTEEQAILARVKGKGVVLITGCGHPGLAAILAMARALCDEPIHAVAGGLHYPLTSGRGPVAGIQMQMILGTGKPPWRPLNDRDLDQGIGELRAAGPKRLLLSAHDTCDHALARLQGELDCRTEVLTVGETYEL